MVCKHHLTLGLDLWRHQILDPDVDTFICSLEFLTHIQHMGGRGIREGVGYQGLAHLTLKLFLSCGRALDGSWGGVSDGCAAGAV